MYTICTIELSAHAKGADPAVTLWGSVGSDGLVNDVGEASFQNAKGFQAAVATGFSAA